MILTALTCAAMGVYPAGNAYAAEAATEAAAADAASMDEYALDDTIVTATRTEKTLLDTPANAQIITAQDIQNGGYLTVFEAVKNF